MNEKFVLVEQDTLESILQILKSLEEAKYSSGSVTADLKLYSSKEAADLLGVCESTLKNLRTGGKIEFIQEQPGGVVRFTYDQLQDYIKSRTMKKFTRYAN